MAVGSSTGAGACGGADTRAAGSGVGRDVRAGGGPFYGRLGTALGRLDLTVEGGVVTRARAINLPVVPDTPHNRRAEDGAPPPEALLAPAPVVLHLIRPFLDELRVRLDHPIGEAAVDLNGDRNDVRRRETNLGNLIADVWRATQGTDVGLQNGGGIRNSIPAGTITLAQVLSVQPFGNTVVTLSLTGAQLRAALENGVSRVEEGSGRFPQLSGVTLVYDSARPAGARVVEVRVGGRPLEDGRRYTLATNSFVGLGGDGYDAFGEAQNVVDTQFVDAEVLADYIRRAGTVAPRVEGRIVDLAAR